MKTTVSFSTLGYTKPDSMTINNDDIDNYEYISIKVYSEDDNKTTYLTLPLRELHFAVKGFYEYAQDQINRDKALE